MKKLSIGIGIVAMCLWGGVVSAQDMQSTPSVSPTQVATVVPTIQTAPLVQPTPAIETAQARPVATSEDIHLKGKFGIGTDNIRIDQNSTSVTSTPSTNSLAALDAIWWISDTSGIDVLGTVISAGAPGVDFDGNPYNYISRDLGCGLGYRRNLSSPCRYLKIQGLVRVTYGQYSNKQEMWFYANTQTNFELGILHSKTLNLMAGLGFEYFMPFCKSLSVQSYVTVLANYNDNDGSTIYNPVMTQYGYTGYKNTHYKTTYWRTAVLVNGLGLSSLAVHFYF
jgi:hypothetical protein